MDTNYSQADYIADAIEQLPEETFWLVNQYLKADGLPFQNDNWNKAQTMVSKEALEEAKEFIALYLV